MQGLATVFHHPIHPIMVAFPIAFFIGSLVADVIYLATRDDFWRRAAFVLIGFGIIGGLGAAVFGFLDFFTAPMTADAKDVATDHMSANLVLVGIFLVNFLLRWKRPRSWFGYVLTLAGVCLLLFSGWLGGHLVYEHYVGVALGEKTPVAGHLHIVE